MSDGWIYCFKNASMKDIYKVGMTTRHPSQRLVEANQSDTWRPPTPYVAVLTRKVKNVRDKESTIHYILSDLGYRLHPRREFFNAPLTLIEKLFSLTDGEPGTMDNDNVSGDEDVIEHAASDKSIVENNPTVHKIQAAELYGNYCSWCDDTDVMLETQNTFGRLLVMEKSCPKVRGRTGFMIYVKQLGGGSIPPEDGDDGDSPVEE